MEIQFMIRVNHLHNKLIIKQLVKHIALVFIVVAFQFQIHAQFSNTSYPILKNFKRSEYNAGMQTWMISQAPNDLMYFANNYGLVEFDGRNWELYGLYNYTIVRSVLATKDGKTYVGLSNNFGYFITDSTGRQQFYSLLHLLPPDKRTIEEIWKIHNTSEGIIFQSFKELIVLKDGEVSIYKAPTEFYFSFHINNKVYIVDWNEGILEFKNGKFLPLPGTNVFPSSVICSILPFGKDLMIATQDNGVYLYKDKKIEEWVSPSSKFLKENQIYCALRIDENQIAFGTIQKGLIICNNEGLPLITMDKSTGLQNNTILCMNLDKSGNLWLGTDNGIDLLYIKSPISQLGLNQGIGSGYTAIIHNNYLYLGTNQGLFYKPLNSLDLETKNTDFKLVERTKGQVWNLQVIDNTLFCGHNKGTLMITGETAEKLGDVPGAWLYLQSEKNPDRIIGGTYTGLILLTKVNGKWLFKQRIKGFNESSRMMFFDKDENIWMSHGFKGVFHIAINESADSVVATRFYNSKKGFKTDFGINIAKLQDQIIFLSSEGAFQYNEMNDTIESSEYFNTFFSNEKINYALEDFYGNIWYFGNYTLKAKMIKNDGTYSDVTVPFKQLQGQFIEGFQFIYPIDTKNFLISYENGFIHYNSALAENQQKPFNLYMSKVELSTSDSVIFKGHLFSNNDNNIPDLNYKDNSIRFNYSAVHFENPIKVEFSTFLEGHDAEWTNWQSRYDREFTNLKEGKYSFHIKARNIYGTETNSLTYEFIINPPWKRTITAYILYLLAWLIIIVVTIFIVRKRIAFLKLREERLQKQKFIEREKELQKEALEAEKELIRLRNDHLQEKLKLKDKELANSTMETIKKNKFLISLKNDMQKNNTEIKSITAKANNKKLIRKIDSEINSENNWQVFETHFGHVHEEFLAKLKQQYPQISPAELRLCACLRMNISSKEIATLLNISLRGVEASRYRLRKALGFDRSVNLTDFILSI